MEGDSDQHVTSRSKEGSAVGVTSACSPSPYFDASSSTLDYSSPPVAARSDKLDAYTPPKSPRLADAHAFLAASASKSATRRRRRDIAVECRTPLCKIHDDSETQPKPADGHKENGKQSHEKFTLKNYRGCNPKYLAPSPSFHAKWALLIDRAKLVSFWRPLVLAYRAPGVPLWKPRASRASHRYSRKKKGFLFWLQMYLARWWFHLYYTKTADSKDNQLVFSCHRCSELCPSFSAVDARVYHRGMLDQYADECIYLEFPCSTCGVIRQADADVRRNTHCPYSSLLYVSPDVESDDVSWDCASDSYDSYDSLSGLADY